MSGTTDATGWSLVAPGCCAARPVHAHSSSSSCGRSAVSPLGACGGIQTWINAGLCAAELALGETGGLELARREVDDHDVGGRCELLDQPVTR